MRQELILRDHRALQHALARATVAGAAAGMLQIAFPGPLAAGLGLLGIPFVAVLPRSPRDLATAGSLLLVGAGAASLGGAAGLAGFGVAGALLFARRSRGPLRWFVATGLGAAALAVGLFVGEGLRAGLGEVVAPALALLAGCSCSGFIGGFGVVGRELDLVPVLPPPPTLPAAVSPGAEAAAQLPPVSRDAAEMAELLLRARLAGDEVHAALATDVPGAAAAASDLLRKIAAFADRWTETERQLVGSGGSAGSAGSDRAALLARTERVTARASSATDEMTRNEYLRAERALRQQLEDLDAIRGWQDRALARLHHQVAVLERLRYAALHRRSAESNRSGDDLAPLVEELSSASFDLDGAAEVLASLPA